MVAAFALAATISLIGAIFAVHLSIIFVRQLKTSYNKFLIGQKQLAVTMKQSKLSKEQGALDLQ